MHHASDRDGWRGRALRLAAMLVLAGVTTTTGARAAPDAEAPAYTLDVDSDDPAVGFDALASQLAGDLSSPIAKAAGGRGRVAIRVYYRAATRELAVRADHGDGRILERTVTASGDSTAVLGEATLLAGNLARDESQELLAALVPAPATAPAPPPAPASAAPAPPAPAGPEPPEYGGTFALVYPLASNVGRPDVGTHLDLSLFFGHVGRVRGAQVGGLAAYAGRGFTGAQVTTAVGVVKGEHRGAALAGLVSVVHGRSTGLQLAAATTVRTEDGKGAQISGGLNLARGATVGVQAAALMNIASAIEGVQLGLFNNATELRGLQLGVVNVGRNVHGLQLGLINIADAIDGQAVGLVSISPDSIHPLVWASNLAYTNGGIKFTGRYLYTVAAVTFGTKESGFRHVGVTTGLGTHLPVPRISPKVDVEPEVDLSILFPTRDTAESNLWVTSRVNVGYSPFDRLRIFAGAGARFAVAVDDGRKIVRPEVLCGVQF